MAVRKDHKSIAWMAFGFLLFAVVIADFLAQTPQPSPTASIQPSSSPSPTPTPTPTPPRVPTPTPFPGAQNAHQWGSITVFNGLPSDHIRAIAQTHDGVMWFGTDNGLARFDGRRIQKIPLGDAGAVSVTALKISPAGDLWIGTRNGAVVHAEGRFAGVENTRGTVITSILLGADSFLGTEGGQVLRVRRDGIEPQFTAEAVLYDPIRGEDGSPLAVTSLQEANGKILAATPGKGVFAVEGPRAIEFQTLPRPAFVNALARDGSGKIWLGTDAARGGSGIFLGTERSRAEKLSAPTADVLALEVNEGGLWAGSERNGLFHFSEGKLKKSYTFATTSGGLRSDTIFTLFTDREGVLWIGTNRGASRFDRIGPQQQTVSEVANSNFIRTLHLNSTIQKGIEPRSILAGSNRGLFERGGENWNEVPAFRARPIYAIYSPAAASGTVLVGTPDGLFDLAGRTILTGEVRAIGGFRGRTYAAVFGRGVLEVTGGPPRLVLANERVTSLSGHADALWIGTEDGSLFRYDGKTAHFERGPETLKSGTIWKIREAANGSGLWIAGQHGVFLIRDSQVQQVAAVEDARDVWEGDDGHVWAATTTKGVIHARHDARFGWLASSIGFEQGLPSEKAFAILPSGGNLLFATNRGVVTYHPAAIAPKLIPVRVISQRVHDPAEFASAIALDHPQKSLLVEVAGQSSRTFPEEFQYAFVLSNAKGETVDSRISSDPQYSPQNLPPDEYTIESIAFDRDLNASEPLVFRFSVGTAPFPWTATALGVLLVISLLGLAWAIVEHRRIKLRNSQLAAARFDLANEAERERRRIARDLHDQTLADLRSLLMKSDSLAGSAAFRGEIEAVSTDIRRICEDLSPSVLENVGLVAALEFLLSRTVEHGTFSADESAEDRISFPLNVQLQIYRIAQEVLTNISKHSGAAAVDLTVDTREPGLFRLIIRDDGEVFHPAAAANGTGRGIANIRSRANLIGAKVNWKSGDRGWNTFTLSLKQIADDSPSV